MVSRRPGAEWVEEAETGVGGFAGMKNDGMDTTVEMMAT